MTKEEFFHYRFYPVTTCNMCGSNSGQHKVLGSRLNQSQGFSPRKKTGIAVSVLKCKDCGLIFSHPQPVPDNIQSHYGIPPEDYWNESYFKPEANYFSLQLSTLKTLMTVIPGMKALDIGAGLGKCMLALQHAGFDAYGMEPSEPFYRKAIEKMKISPEKLKPGMKWLKPGGLIHIEVPSSRHLVGKLINLYYRLRGTTYVTNLSPMHAPFHLYEFDPRSFIRLGKKLDFQIVKQQFYVCDILFFPGFVKPLLAAYMKATNTGMQLEVWLKKN